MQGERVELHADYWTLRGINNNGWNTRGHGAPPMGGRYEVT